MADRFSKVAAFILGPSPRDDEDDFESEPDSSGDEPTDIVEVAPVKSAMRERPAPGSVTSLEQRRRPLPSRPVVISEIRHVRPYSFSEAAAIGESYKEGTPIILNFTTTDEKQAQKLIDFASGMAFVTGGKLERITPRVFILIPATVQLTATDRELMEDQYRRD
jgi:cell division inhibitor SepF